MKRWSKLIVFFLTCFLGSASAQTHQFDHITDKDGLINNSVTSIIKDNDGFMWFGTMNGLSKYDGYSFTSYIHEPGNPNSMKDNYVRSLLHARDGRIYICFRSHGFCIYDKDKEFFENFEHQDGNINSLGSNNVATVYEDKVGNIWIGTSRGLDKFDYATKKFRHYYPFQHNKFGFVSSITEDEQGNLWLYGMGTTLCKFNPNSNSYTYFKFSESEGLNAVFVLGGQLKYDSRGNLWVGNELDGLSRHDFKTGKAERYSVENGKLKSNVIIFIAEDQEHNVWIGADGAGLYKYSYSTNQLTHIHSNADDPYGLSGSAVYCLFESEPGMLWFGTYASGVNILKKNKRKFNLVKNEGAHGKHLNAKSVVCITDAKDGNIWLGMNGGGMIYFDRKTLECTAYTEENSIVCGDIVKCIEVDSKKNIWCGTYGNGLCKINLETGKKESFRQDVHSSSFTVDRNHIWALKTIEGKLWIGTLTGTLTIYDPVTHTFHHDPLNNHDDFSPRGITSFAQDTAGNVWIGSEQVGVFCYNPHTGLKKRFSRKIGGGNFLGNDVRDIFLDRRGKMWFATQKAGLVELVDPVKDIFRSFTVNDGLPSNNIRKIIEDDKGNLWLSTDKGVSCFNPGKKYFRNFDAEDGLQGNEFNPSSGFRAADGCIYFGGIDGLNFFYPDSIKYNNTPPKVVLTDFKIFNLSIKPNREYNGKVVMKKSISSIREISLDYQSHSFTLEFAALNFDSPNKNKYAYKMEGFDHQWVHVNSDKRFATYTNLDPGEYTFRVIASNNDGVWNKEGVSLKIRVTPPWWMHWLFRLSASLAITFAACFIYYIRWRSVHEQKIKLEKEVEKRSAELNDMNAEIILKSKILEKNNHNISVTSERIFMQQQEILKQRDALEQSNKTKDRFFSIIGHDLRNPVTSLSFLVSQLKVESKNTPVGNDVTLGRVETTVEKIHKLVLNILEWARTQSAQVNVKRESCSLRELLNEHLQFIKHAAKEKGIEVTLLMREDVELFIDKSMVGTALRNILSNSIQFNNQNGKVKIQVRDFEDAVEIVIEDTGNGMNKADVQKLFKVGESVSCGKNKEKGTGLGLLIANEYLSLNNGKIKAESQPGKGSVFTIRLEKVMVLKTQ